MKDEVLELIKGSKLDTGKYSFMGRSLDLQIEENKITAEIYYLDKDEVQLSMTSPRGKFIKNLISVLSVLK